MNGRETVPYTHRELREQEWRAGELRAQIELFAGDYATIRPARRADFNDLLEIEREAFEYPWSREEFEYCLRAYNAEIILIERDETTLGYLVYERRRQSLRILSVAVAKSARRKKVGARLIWRLKTKLDDSRRKIVCAVRERNVAAQVFLREMGFRADLVVRNYYSETSEDAYHMIYAPDEERVPDAESFRRRLLNR